jgi:hypothetical protein
MIDGIYHVTFSSNSNDFGEGIVVFKDGAVNGGDHGYLYYGDFTQSAGQLNSNLTIKQWNSSVQSVFGPKKEFTLVLGGNISDDKNFMAKGHVAGQSDAQITIRGRYLSAAA